jgi:hypothetical protein
VVIEAGAFSYATIANALYMLYLAVWVAGKRFRWAEELARQFGLPAKEHPSQRRNTQ